MGGGSYSYLKSATRAKSYASSSISQTFTSKTMPQEMNIKGKDRESCDSTEHPESFPIILALDVTGSMGKIPYYLISNAFPKIMKVIMEQGIKDPQVCFMGIGDHYYDQAPIQVGQFESSDELLDKWLKLTWLEGRGGGNWHESYTLAHYYAANHIKTDSFDKRGKKGVLITIGDEPCNPKLESESIERQFGDKGVPTMEAKDLIAAAQQKWNVFHINVVDHAGIRVKSEASWETLLGDNVIHSQDSDGKDIAGIISGLILESYGIADAMNKDALIDYINSL